MKYTGRKKKSVLSRLNSIRFNFERFSKLVETGVTDEQICRILGINPSTLWRWKSDFEFETILREAKEVADSIAERSLFQRANGYDYLETEYSVILPDEKKGVKGSDDKLVMTKKTLKHMPADVTALIFWLSNRKSKVWKRTANGNDDSAHQPAIFLMPVFTDAKMLIPKDVQKQIEGIKNQKAIEPVNFKELKPSLKLKIK